MAFNNETFIQQIVDVIREDVVNSDFYKDMNKLPKFLTVEQKIYALQDYLETPVITKILQPIINNIQKLSLDEIRKLLITNADINLGFQDSYEEGENEDAPSILVGIDSNNFLAIKNLCLSQIDFEKQLVRNTINNQPSRKTFNEILKNTHESSDFDFDFFKNAYEQSNILEIRKDENSIENINKMLQFYDIAAEYMKQQILDSSIDEFMKIYKNSISIFSFNNIISIYNNTNDENLHEIKQHMIDLHKKRILDNYKRTDYPYKNSFRIIDTSLDYYSAYLTSISKEEFAHKNMVWFTKRLDQSILHPLDNKDITEPVMFKFKLLRPIVVLYNNIPDNTDIFDFISTNIKTKFIKLLNCIETRTPNADGSESITPEIFLFTISNNKNILYVVEAINRIFCGTFYFDGYMNPSDQDEIAVIHFYDIVNPSKIDKFNYVNIYQKTQSDPNDPDNSKEIIKNINIPYSGPNIGNHYYMMKMVHLMKCGQNETLKIKYENDSTKEKYVFDCNDYKTHTAPYLYQDPIQAKYLKYKQKYLKLKAQIL
jgi:hypothetical protein